MVERFPYTIGHLGEGLGATTGTKYEFVDTRNGNREKRIPDRRIQRQYETLFAGRPQTVGRSRDSLLARRASSGYWTYIRW